MDPLNRACVASFARAGHKVTVYSSDDQVDLPAGVAFRPMAEVWDPPAAFLAAAPPVFISDLFRLRLLAARDDVIWVDADIYCLRPFDFDADRVFAIRDGLAETAVMRLPPEDPILLDWLTFAFSARYAPAWLSRWRRKEARALRDAPVYERLLGLHQIRRGVLGPKAFTHYLGAHQAEADALPPKCFYPVGANGVGRLFSAGSLVLARSPDVYAVHFYNRNIEWARAAGHQIFADPHPSSFAAYVLGRA